MVHVIRMDVEIPRYVTGYVEIWLDASTGVWCIGPPRGQNSTAILLKQVDPLEFFAAQSLTKPGKQRDL